MAHTSDPTEPSTLAAAFNDKAQRTDGLCHSSRRFSAVGNGIPITKPAGEISAAVIANFSSSGNPTPAASSGVTTAASSATRTAIRISTRFKAAVVVPQDSPAEIAAQPAGDQHREDHHRERVGGMSQEKHELLDQGHFDQNVARAD